MAGWALVQFTPLAQAVGDWYALLVLPLVGSAALAGKLLARRARRTRQRSDSVKGGR